MIGIGKEASEEFIIEGARIGGGKSEFLLDEETCHEKLINMLKYTRKIQYDSVQLFFDEEKIDKIFPNPNLIMYLKLPKILTFFIFLKRQFESTTIAVKINEKCVLKEKIVEKNFEVQQSEKIKDFEMQIRKVSSEES